MVRTWSHVTFALALCIACREPEPKPESGELPDKQRMCSMAGSLVHRHATDSRSLDDADSRQRALAALRFGGPWLGMCLGRRPVPLDGLERDPTRLWEVIVELDRAMAPWLGPTRSLPKDLDQDGRQKRVACGEGYEIVAEIERRVVAGDVNARADAFELFYAGVSWLTICMGDAPPLALREPDAEDMARLRQKMETWAPGGSASSSPSPPAR
jgi:hypothetical protein